MRHHLIATAALALALLPAPAHAADTDSTQAIVRPAGLSVPAPDVYADPASVLSKATTPIATLKRGVVYDIGAEDVEPASGWDVRSIRLLDGRSGYVSMAALEHPLERCSEDALCEKIADRTVTSITTATAWDERTQTRSEDGSIAVYRAPDPDASTAPIRRIALNEVAETTGRVIGRYAEVTVGTTTGWVDWGRSESLIAPGDSVSTGPAAGTGLTGTVRRCTAVTYKGVGVYPRANPTAVADTTPLSTAPRWCQVAPVDHGMVRVSLDGQRTGWVERDRLSVDATDLDAASGGVTQVTTTPTSTATDEPTSTDAAIAPAPTTTATPLRDRLASAKAKASDRWETAKDDRASRKADQAPAAPSRWQVARWLLGHPTEALAALLALVVAGWAAKRAIGQRLATRGRYAMSRAASADRVAGIANAQHGGTEPDTVGNETTRQQSLSDYL